MEANLRFPLSPKTTKLKLCSAKTFRLLTTPRSHDRTTFVLVCWPRSRTYRGVRRRHPNLRPSNGKSTALLLIHTTKIRKISVFLNLLNRLVKTASARRHRSCAAHTILGSTSAVFAQVTPGMMLDPTAQAVNMTYFSRRNSLLPASSASRCRSQPPPIW
ncbi:hypothetical protein JG688_00017344 [Phytophthora aleatoria]|uniref:Uncharacterized protein n=1 Tax=Phytophthora aleatoria TaxID=2496075 RepID=A0A8J5LYL6_9STRA|nr:hypothetical protein JG688_00017344 [Phytophthora aleatoria]